MFRRLPEVDSIIVEYPDRLARGGRKVKKDIEKSLKELSMKGKENSENNDESNINK